MLFSGDEGLKATEALSGGEAARLLMAKLMLMKHPVLIFDEPTNHLDLEAVSALAEGLSVYQGTVFVVTHDRDLVSDVATRILSFTPDGIIDFHGRMRNIWKHTRSRSITRKPTTNKPGTSLSRYAAALPAQHP